MTYLSLKRIKISYAIFLLLGLALLSLAFSVRQAKAAAGDFTLTVKDELTVNLAGATVTATCPGGSSSISMTNVGDGTYTAVAANMQGAAADCADTEAITFTVAKDGYVTTVNSSTTYTIGSDPDTYTLSPGVPFAVKVVLDDETTENDNVSGAGAVQAGGTSCTEDGSTGVYYCIVPLATLSTDVVAQKDGYVQKTISSAFNDRIAATDAQRIVGTGGDVTTAFNFQFAHKVTVTREADSAAFSGATVTAGSGATSCDEDGVTGVYYCPVPVAQDGGTNDVTIVKGGYVTNATGDTSDRTVQTGAQGTVTVSGVQFAYRITSITTQVVGADLTATVTTLEVGDDTARDTCVLNTGVWYCPVTTANSNGTMIARVVKDGYVDLSTYALVGNTTRATDATAQVSETISTVQYSYKATAITTQVVATDITATVSSLALGDDTGQTSCALSSGTWYCPVVLANSDGTLTADVAKDGYVRQTSYALTGSSSRAANTDAQVSVTIGSILYAAKVTSVATEISGSITTVTVDTGDSYAVSCTESGGAWYCPVPLAQTGVVIRAAKDGYVTNTSNSFTADRTTETDAQQTKAITGVAFAYKVEGVVTELGGSLSTVTVATGDAYGTSCTENTGAWYCAVPLANTEIAISAAKDGYVTNTATSFSADRTAATDAQATSTVTGVLFAQKVTATREADSAALSGATVTAGSGATSCTENGSTGIYYCPVPVAQDGVANDVTIVKAGYVTDTTGDTSDRADGTGAQGAITVSSIDFAYKITSITTETVGADLTATVTTLEVGDDTARNTCVANGGVWYCPVETGNSNGTMIARVVHDGYVDKNTYALVLNTTRATDATAQVSETINSVQYAYTVTGITAEATASDLTATVSSLALGDGTGQTSCALSGGTWYCPVVLANSDGTLTADVAKDGYVRKTTYALTGSSSRAANTTAQVAGVTVADIQYAFKVTGVATELSGALSSVTVETGNTYGVSCTENSGAWYCVVPLAHTGVTIRATKDGYVTNTGTSFDADRTAETDAQQTKAVTGVLFSQKITVTREGDSAALTGATVTTTGPTTFTEDGTTGVYYGAVTLANDNGTITVAKTGYKTNTSATASDRTLGADAQGTATATALFQLKLITADELGTAVNISALDLVKFNGSSPTYSSTNTAYFAVTAANATLDVQKDGYVNATTTNAGMADVTTTASDQTVVTMGNNAAQAGAISGTGATAKGLMYALKVTVTREGDSAAVTGSTVTAGDSYGTACAENSTTGIHYCAIPVANTGAQARIVNSSYTTKYLNYTDRTATTTAQGTLTATLNTPGETTAPTVSSQTPTDDSTSVAITVSPTVTFSEAMDAATLNGGTVKLKKYSDDSDVTSTLLYNPSTYVVTLDPDASLTNNTQYYIWISGAKDAAGNTLSTDYSTSAKASHEFTTVAASAAPTVTAQTPTDNTTGSAITISPTVTFSEAMDASTINSGTVKLKKYSDDSDITVTLNYNPTTYVVTLDPVASLDNNTQYYLWVSGAKNSGGTSVTDYTTKASQEFTTTADTTTLAVTGVSTVANPAGTTGYATADGTYNNGWTWTFSVTASSTQTALAMKFADFVSGANSIAVATSSSAGIIRYCSAQATTYDCSSDAEDSSTWRVISAANSYGGNITLSSDSDSTTAGRQVTVKVQMKVPYNSSAGSYSSTYGIQTTTP